MRRHIIIMTALLSAGVYQGCKIDRLPETTLSDSNFWNNEGDLQNAANRLYEQLGGFSIDTRSDEYVGTDLNVISNSTRGLPSTSNDWSFPFQQIFTANNILQKGGQAKTTDAIKNRYFGEARFFRAYYNFMLLQKYGDVPLLLKTLNPSDPDITMGRTDRETVLKAIYDDLDFAANWLPTRAALLPAQYGRATRSTALAFKARVALYAGTWAKFRQLGGWQDHMQKAVDAATAVMGQGHTLFRSYQGMFTRDGEGQSNTENIFVKIYGVNSTNLILTHNTSRDLENGRIAPTRNLIQIFPYTDGLSAYNTDGSPSSRRSPLYVPERNEASYNTVLDNRDPRIATLVFRSGETAYKGPWVPTTSLGSRSGFAGKKGFSNDDWAINNSAITDKALIRYAEVLLIYAEAKFELTESISDADLNNTVNALRTRAGATAKLTNAFVSANGLSMREEIRRERTVELSLEGFRYDDLIRWKTAAQVLPQALIGAKFTNTTEWVGTNPSTLSLNSDGVIVVENAARRAGFDQNRDYLYPIPLNEITLSNGNIKQNAGW